MANPKQQLEALGRMDVDAFHQCDKLPLVLVLDNIRSGLNVGSLFRTSDAYRVQEIRLCGITAQPPQKDIKKTALGATDSVAWSYWETTAVALDDLRANGYRVAAIEQAAHTHMLDAFHPGNAPWAVVLGNEVRGVDQAIVDSADAVLELPQFGTKHSLNVSVCGGIVVWEWWRKCRPFE